MTSIRDIPELMKPGVNVFDLMAYCDRNNAAIIIYPKERFSMKIIDGKLFNKQANRWDPAKVVPAHEATEAVDRLKVEIDDLKAKIVDLKKTGQKTA